MQILYGQTSTDAGADSLGNGVNSPILNMAGLDALLQAMAQTNQSFLVKTSVGTFESRFSNGGNTISLIAASTTVH